MTSAFEELPKGPAWRRALCWWFNLHTWDEWHKAWPEHRIRSCKHCRRCEIEKTF